MYFNPQSLSCHNIDAFAKDNQRINLAENDLHSFPVRDYVRLAMQLQENVVVDLIISPVNS